VTDVDFWSIHEAACERGETTYVDPQTGFVVFTRLGLLARDRCCGAGCRHCPFGHESVPTKRKASRIQQPAWLTDARPAQTGEQAFLFWSGGKDSFLALRAMQRQGRFAPILLTTFDARSRIIAHQEFAIDEVVAQAEALGVPLVGVPLHSGADYVEQLVPALQLAPDCQHLSFGDLHLEHIREWRETAFARHERTAAMTLEFPLWQADYKTLLEDLAASGAECEISALAAELPGISVGDRYDGALIAKLPAQVDAFGENGEFHTKIVIANT
jgi:diphthamide synthase (EF-2-diphthine--ammonia ligase)